MSTETADAVDMDIDFTRTMPEVGHLVRGVPRAADPDYTWRPL